MTTDGRGRDPFTAQYWNGRADVVALNPRSATGSGFDLSVRRISEALLGRMLSDEEWAGIVGASDGSELTLVPARIDFGDEVRHSWIQRFALRRVVRILGQLVIRNEGLVLSL